jgi:hypothetical protein
MVAALDDFETDIYSQNAAFTDGQLTKLPTVLQYHCAANYVYMGATEFETVSFCAICKFGPMFLKAWKPAGNVPNEPRKASTLTLKTVWLVTLMISLSKEIHLGERPIC